MNIISKKVGVILCVLKLVLVLSHVGEMFKTKLRNKITFVLYLNNVLYVLLKFTFMSLLNGR